MRDILVDNTDHNRKSLRKAAKSTVADEANSALLNNLQSLERQGHTNGSTDIKCVSVWSLTVQLLPEEQIKFSLNAAVDVLPHNANLHLWYRYRGYRYRGTQHADSATKIKLCFTSPFGLKKLNTTCTSYHSQCNGMVEHTSRTLKSKLRKHAGRLGLQWDECQVFLPVWC